MLPTPLQGLNQGGSSGTQASAGITINGHAYYFGESYCAGTVGDTTATVESACPSNHGGDQYQIIPKYYGPVSNGPGGAAMTPAALPVGTLTGINTGAANATGLEWPLVNGWLLVEVKWASDQAWHGVTQEWLQLGFARGLQVPTRPGLGCTPPTVNAQGTYGCNYVSDHKNAILYFQETADRNGNNAFSGVGLPTGDAPDTANLYGYGSQYNWYPINFYDAREGENNDNNAIANNTGTPNGVMNAVELDAGNLRTWLLCTNGVSPCTGTNVDYATQNGYVLYFSDRRGEQFATSAQGANYQQEWGEYGYEDTVNYSNSGASFAPDGHLDPLNYNNVSPEDVNGNNLLDVYGVKYVGDAFGTQTTSDTDTIAIKSPYALGHRFNP